MDSTEKCAYCLVCDKQLLRCSRCKAVYYCGLECQKKHFPTHKLVCAKPVEVKPHEPQKEPEGIDEFGKLECIGNGNFSTIFRGKSSKDGRIYAIKQVEKARLKSLRKEADIFMEKHCLSKLNDCSYVVKLCRTFQDELHLFLQMECPENGELWEVAKNFGIISQSLFKYYLSHILKAVGIIHEKYQIVHRDLKPQNVLLNSLHEIKLIDFGTAKDLSRPDIKGSGNGLKGREPFHHYVGTPNYMAPECIHNKASEKLSDVYSLSGLIYFLKVGSPPFAGGSEYLIFKKSLGKPLFLAEQLFNQDLRDLLSQMGKKEMGERISLATACKHPYFKDMDFDNLPTYAQSQERMTQLERELQRHCSTLNDLMKGLHKMDIQAKRSLYSKSIEPNLLKMEESLRSKFDQQAQKRLFVMRLQIEAAMNLKENTNHGFEELYKEAKGIVDASNAQEIKVDEPEEEGQDQK